MSRAKNDKVVGEVGYNNNGERMTIVRYGNYYDIDVQFDDGTIVEHRRYGHFLKGQIKNPYFPSVYGVGFIGVGKFKPYNNFHHSILQMLGSYSILYKLYNLYKLGVSHGI